MANHINCLFLLGAFSTVLLIVSGAMKSCESDEDCPKKSVCVDLNDASVCLCKRGFKMVKNNTKCIKKKPKSPGSNTHFTKSATTKPPTTTPAATTTTEFGNNILRYVTQLSTPFPRTSMPCSGLINNPNTRMQCSFGGQCVHDEKNQNYCSCHPLLRGVTCNSEVVRTNSRESFDPSVILYKAKNKFFPLTGNNGPRSTMGFHEIETLDECMIACHEIRRCQSIQFGPMKDVNGKTVNVCEFNSATLHPDQNTNFFSASNLTDRNGFTIACCFESQWDLKKYTSK